MTNRIALPGFYDDVVELADWERAELEVLDDKVEAEKLGVGEMAGEKGYRYEYFSIS